MPTDIERLAVLIEANTKSYEKSMAKVEQRTQQALSKVERQYKDAGDRIDGFLSKVGSRLFAGGALVAAGRALTGFKGIVDSLSEIADASERAGVSTDFLQALSQRVELAGGSMEDAARAAQKFGKGLGDVNVEQSYLGRLFAANGSNIAKFKDDANGAFQEFARIVANARTTQEGMNMVSEVFGEKVGPKMRTTIEEIGRVGLPQFIAGMREAGAVIDEQIINKADQIGDKWDLLIKNLGNKFKSFVVETVSEWEILISALTDKPMVEAVKPEDRQRITVTPGRPSVNVGGTAPSKTRADDLDRDLKRLREQIALMEKEAEVIDLGTYARERAMIVTKLETAAKEANIAAGKKNIEVSEQQRAKISEMADAYAAAALKVEQARGPLREFAREGANVALQVQEALVGGLKNFEDQLIQTMRTGKLEFRSFAESVISDFARIWIRSQITAPLAGVFNSILGGMSGFSLPGFATGGSFKVGGSGGADSKVVSFRATPGEMVNVSKKGGHGNGTTYAPIYNIDARGADQGAVVRIEHALAKFDREFEPRVINTTRAARTQRKLA